MKILVFLLLLLPVALMAQTKKTVVKKTTIKKITTTSNNALQSSVARGKTVYATNCLVCHQANGSGVPNLNPPLKQTSWVLGSQEVLISQVLKGSKGTVEINGDRFENAMPAQAHLTDQQIADVLSYIRNSFGNKASIVTPAEVKMVRAKEK